MRLWSIHPKYLDRLGLLAVWREGLLALKVLKGRTKGYKNHPQLVRFKNHKNPIKMIKLYLFEIYKEAEKRKYSFNIKKIGQINKIKIKETEKIPITLGQVKYEFNHLLKKLKIRDKKKYEKIRLIKKIAVHPIFKIVAGEKEKWEK